jgi:hypothetical protein
MMATISRRRSWSQSATGSKGYYWALRSEMHSAFPQRDYQSVESKNYFRGGGDIDFSSILGWLVMTQTTQFLLLSAF